MCIRFKWVGWAWSLVLVMASPVWPQIASAPERPQPESLVFHQKPEPAGSSVLSHEEKIVIDVFQQVHQAVVNIVTTTLSLTYLNQVVPEEGQGTGFVIDPKGYILTNHHVVENAGRILVTTGDGRKTEAKLIGRDPVHDLAVIQISQGLVKAVAILGDSDRVQVGQKTIAIGNPFGLSQTLTTGSVSALHRDIPNDDGDLMVDLIQTDAAINPGNSGGPLLNTGGEVIGINGAIFSMTGGYQGIGFAIPSNKAREVAVQLVTKGHYRAPWLGIMGLGLDEIMSKELGLPVAKGVLVVTVAPDSPARAAGIVGGRFEQNVGSLRLPVGGDVVLALAGTAVSTMGELIREVERHPPGEKIAVDILRDGQKQTLAVTLQ